MFSFIFRAIFILSGIFCILVGIKMRFGTSRFAKSAEEAQGKVISDRYDYSNVTKNIINGRSVGYSADAKFEADITFCDNHGIDRNFTYKYIKPSSEYGYPTAEYKEGDTVDVLFDPGNPEKAMVKNFANLYVGLLIVLGGLVCEGLGVLLIVF